MLSFKEYLYDCSLNEAIRPQSTAYGVDEHFSDGKFKKIIHKIGGGTISLTSTVFKTSFRYVVFDIQEQATPIVSFRTYPLVNGMTVDEILEKAYERPIGKKNLSGPEVCEIIAKSLYLMTHVMRNHNEIEFMGLDTMGRIYEKLIRSAAFKELLDATGFKIKHTNETRHHRTNALEDLTVVLQRK